MTQLLTHVANTVTSAVTTFESYAFNSMTLFQGKYLGASDSGITQLDAPVSTEVINGVLTTGALDFNSDKQKRCSDFYLSMRSQGDVTLTVTTDDATPNVYVVSPLAVDTLKQRRTPIGKGLKGRYWTFQLECSDTFDYDAMTISMASTTRRL